MQKLTVKKVKADDWATEIAGFVAAKIKAELAIGQKVILILAGGSVARSYLHLVQFLRDQNLGGLTFCLADERVFNDALTGAETNLQLLNSTGIINKLRDLGANYIDLPNDSNLAAQSLDYLETDLTEVLTSPTTTSIAILGVGTDGHIAGVKPLSNPSDFHQEFLTSANIALYAASDFPERLTLTLTALRSLDQIVIGLGNDKKAVLETLEMNFNNEDASQESIANYPSLALKDSNAEITIFAAK